MIRSDRVGGVAALGCEMMPAQRGQVASPVCVVGVRPGYDNKETDMAKRIMNKLREVRYALMHSTCRRLERAEIHPGDRFSA